jgi:hypothetical protein
VRTTCFGVRRLPFMLVLLWSICAGPVELSHEADRSQGFGPAPQRQSWVVERSDGAVRRAVPGRVTHGWAVTTASPPVKHTGPSPPKR